MNRLRQDLDRSEDHEMLKVSGLIQLMFYVFCFYFFILYLIHKFYLPYKSFVGTPRLASITKLRSVFIMDAKRGVPTIPLFRVCHQSRTLAVCPYFFITKNSVIFLESIKNAFTAYFHLKILILFKFTPSYSKKL